MELRAVTATANESRDERRFLDTKPEARAEDGARVVLAGYSALFDIQTIIRSPFDEFREQIAPGAFATAIAEDDVRCLWNHNPDIVLGRNRSGTLRLREDERGLFSECEPPDAARYYVELIERGDVSQQSFGFVVESDEWRVEEGNAVPLLRTIRKVRLFDVSPVTYPAYPATTVHVRASIESVKAEFTRDKGIALDLFDRYLRLKEIA